MPKYEIELKRIEYGYVIVKADNANEAITKYQEQGGNEIFYPENVEIKQIGHVNEAQE